ncbi:MAG: carboxyltransferase domain-containing protein [Pseudomonadota bacterium]
MTPEAPRQFPKIRTLGVCGILVTFADKLSEPANRAALSFRATVDVADISGIQETSMSLTSVFVEFDPLAIAHDEIMARLAVLLDERDWYAAPLPAGRQHFAIPAVFSGTLAPQLDEAAKAAGIARETAIEDLTHTRLRVMTIGFAPGQPYLGELPPAWNIPRQQALTPQVPQGAIVAAIRQLVLFSAPNSTGWRHIGQTAFQNFRPEAERPFALSPGDEVSFYPIEEGMLQDILSENTDGLGGAVVEALP